MKRYALTAVGRDKPGIVAAVTRALFDHGCNIEDSSMTTLQDEFAIILIMSADERMDAGSLKKALKAAENSLALTIHLKEIEKQSPDKIPSPTHIVTVMGYDKPGIVCKTAELLSKLDVNITDLSTRVLRGDGKDSYLMLMETYVPGEAQSKAVETELRALGSAMEVKIELRPIEDYGSL